MWRTIHATTILLAAFGSAAAQADDEVSVATMPPVVVKTVPQSGDTAVDPSITEIRVTFSKEMMDGTWSWTQISNETFPPTTGKPRYLADKRTCVLAVKLTPGKSYVTWLNSAKFDNFKDTGGRSAVPYLLVFETAATSGEAAVAPAAAKAIADTRAAKFAKVKVHSGGDFLALRKDAQLWKDFNNFWLEIPKYLDGTSFLQNPSLYQGSVKFEIEKSGLLVLAVTSRWKESGNPSGGWMEKAISPEDFVKQGWRKFGRLHQTTQTPGEECGHHWDLYSRECRQGEKFDLRTEKYCAPIIIYRTEGAADDEASSPRTKRDWGPEQATGAPDTTRAGDEQTAWASLTEDDQPEWLLLEYAKPVRAKEIHVYESFNPLALSKITAFDSRGKEVTVWEPPQVAYPVHGVNGYYDSTQVVTEGGVKISKFPVKVDVQIQRVKLYLDSSRAKGWNEIDAVGLVDAAGKTHWATKAEASSTFADYGAKSIVPPVEVVLLPEGTVALSHVGDASTDKRSIGGSGHAVAFDRPDEQKHVIGVQIYASRYGYPKPPDENFHVYLLDEKMKVIKDFAYPYGAIERSGQMRWYTLKVPPTEVPEQYHVAVSFNPHRTKGIYLGMNKNVNQSHSYVGLPADGFEPVAENYDWMIRALLTAGPNLAKGLRGGVSVASSDDENPFEP